MTNAITSADLSVPTAREEADREFDLDFPHWQADLAAFDAREAGITLLASDLDDYLAPTGDYDRAIRDWDAFIAMSYVDLAEREF